MRGRGVVVVVVVEKEEAPPEDSTGGSVTTSLLFPHRGRQRPLASAEGRAGTPGSGLLAEPTDGKRHLSAPAGP